MLFVIQENATSSPRGAVRRHSLLSQTSIKRLFKWKARSSLLFSDPFFLRMNILNLNRGSLSTVGPVIRVVGDSRTQMNPLVWPTITTFSPARKVKITKWSIWAPAGCYSVPEPSLAGGQPYNTTMQCYCGQNSCPLCNLLLNLQITNTGID